MLTKYGFANVWFNSLSLTSGFLAGQNWETVLSKAAVHTRFPWRHVADKAGFVHTIFSNRKPQHSSTDLSKRGGQLWHSVCSPLEPRVLFLTTALRGNSLTPPLRGQVLSLDAKWRNTLDLQVTCWTRTGSYSSVAAQVQPGKCSAENTELQHWQKCSPCCSTCKVWDDSCLFLFKTCSRTAMFWTWTFLWAGRSSKLLLLDFTTGFNTRPDLHLGSQN